MSGERTGFRPLEQADEAFDLSLHVFAKERDAFGVVQVAVRKQPEPGFVLDLGFRKPHQRRIAFTQEHLDAVARELNERPRMTLNYYSPAEKFEECVAAIG